MNTVKLINRPSFGHKERLYPDCDTSRKLAAQLKRTCLRRQDIEFLESLGFTVEVETPKI